MRIRDVPALDDRATHELKRAIARYLGLRTSEGSILHGHDKIGIVMHCNGRFSGTTRLQAANLGSIAGFSPRPMRQA